MPKSVEVGLGNLEAGVEQSPVDINSAKADGKGHNLIVAAGEESRGQRLATPKLQCPACSSRLIARSYNSASVPYRIPGVLTVQRAPGCRKASDGVPHRRRNVVRPLRSSGDSKQS